MNNLFKITLIVIAIFLGSCNNQGILNKENKENTSYSTLENCNMKEQFMEYRDNLKQKKISTLANTFNFPYTNNVWRVIAFNAGEEEKLDEHSLDQPFEKNDLKENFDEIFPKEFVTCIGEINVKQLFSEGEFITDNIKVIEGEICRMTSSFDESKKEIVLVLSYDFYEDGEKYESSINYFYSFKECDMKMDSLLLIN